MCELVRTDETMGQAILFLLINYGRFAVIAVIRNERMPKIECEKRLNSIGKKFRTFLLFSPFVNKTDWIFHINRINIQNAQKKSLRLLLFVPLFLYFRKFENRRNGSFEIFVDYSESGKSPLLIMRTMKSNVKVNGIFRDFSIQ